MHFAKSEKAERKQLTIANCGCIVKRRKAKASLGKIPATPLFMSTDKIMYKVHEGICDRVAYVRRVSREIYFMVKARVSFRKG